MTLNKRTMLVFAVTYAFLLIATFVYTRVRVRDEVENELARQYSDYLLNTASELEFFFGGVTNDLEMFADNPLIARAAGKHFTSFLAADPATFSYHYGSDELELISLFAAYRANHPSVNSVYLGLADGSFVRSHPRAQPTSYDPRTRPWYVAAAEVPGKVIRTAAYPSVTTQDVNIATVKALQKPNGEVYGVIGIDVTLDHLSRQLRSKLLSYNGHLELWAPDGSVLISSTIPAGSTGKIVGTGSFWNHERRIGDCLMDSGPLGYRFRYVLSVPDGTLVAIIPADGVEKVIQKTIVDRFLLITAFVFLIFGIVIVMLRQFILVPLGSMSSLLAESAALGVPEKMNVPATGELADFQDHYNRLVELVDRENAELKKTKFLVITSLASLAQKRDNETGLHILRTQKYMDVLANSWNQLFPADTLSADRVRLLVQCAPLHDIGKVAIPDCILLKPGALTDLEFEEMKRHTTYGKEAIEKGNVDIEDHAFMATSLSIVHLHHERWDGTGYPLGLKGEAIPLEARFMALADVYDALTTVRPYKGAYSHEKSLGIIRDSGGTQFDPRVVQAFIAIERRFDEIAIMYREDGAERDDRSEPTA